MDEFDYDNEESTNVPKEAKPTAPLPTTMISTPSKSEVPPLVPLGRRTATPNIIDPRLGVSVPSTSSSPMNRVTINPSALETLQQGIISSKGELSNSVLSDESKKAHMEEDKAFLELLEQIENFQPLIPDEMTDYFLMKAGCSTEDVKIKRLLALLTQKYITDIAQDAYQYAKFRHQSVSGTNTSSLGTKEKKLILTMDDLGSALGDYGIHLRKPPYYR